ncbi:MAG: tail fiber domain-containing protein, partial [Salinibacter sp.]
MFRRAVVCPGFGVVIALLGVLAAASPAAAQPAAQTVTDLNGKVLFQVNENGGLWAPGTFGDGRLPAEGAGTRLLWHPGKAAFRAGRVGFGMSNGTEWAAASIGAYSFATGVNTRASGRGAVALGQGTAATGPQSVAGGYQTTAAGLRSMAVGDNTTARGTFSTALGLNTTASASASVVLGRWNVVRGTPEAWRGTDPLLVAGNGRGPSARSNALMLRKNGDLRIAGTLTESSDRRFKTDIEALGPVGDALERLRPVRFRFETGTGHPSGPQVGLLAQDVRAEFPSLVQEGADGRLGLAYPRLTAVLLRGLQEQRTRIDSLQQRLAQVERLANTQDKLAAQVAALKDASSTRPAPRSGGLGMSVGMALLLLVMGGLVGAALMAG